MNSSVNTYTIDEPHMLPGVVLSLVYKDTFNTPSLIQTIPSYKMVAEVSSLD
jgi:hypothetical protein